MFRAAVAKSTIEGGTTSVEKCAAGGSGISKRTKLDVLRALDCEALRRLARSSPGKWTRANNCRLVALRGASLIGPAAHASVESQPHIRELSPDRSEIVVPHVAQVEVDKEQQENVQHAKKIHGHRITGDAC